MKIETSLVLVLDSFTILQSKSFSFSFERREAQDNPIVQEAKQKNTKAPKCQDYKNSLFMSETTNATNYSIRSKLQQLSVGKKNKLALNPFDEKRMYFNPLQNLPWDKHTQQGDCPCLYCLKFILF